MFKKVSQVAEKAATNVSRRHFLGRFGRAAGVAGEDVPQVLRVAGDPFRAEIRRFPFFKGVDPCLRK